MQGRLIPKFQGHYQSLPAFHWQSEFFIANEMGFTFLEFILDSWSLNQNPLLVDLGRREIEKISQMSGVAVRSICADVFIDIPFVFQENQHDPRLAIKIMRQIIAAAVDLGIRDIVVPCVDRSSIPDEGGQLQFIQTLSPLCQEAIDKGIRLNI